mgnify:CR=1 FL=1
MVYLDIQNDYPKNKLKEVIKEAILEGEIQNDADEAFRYMLKLGKEMGLETNKD